VIGMNPSPIEAFASDTCCRKLMERQHGGGHTDERRGVAGGTTEATALQVHGPSHTSRVATGSAGVPELVMVMVSLLPDDASSISVVSSPLATASNVPPARTWEIRPSRFARPGATTIEPPRSALHDDLAEHVGIVEQDRAAVAKNEAARQGLDCAAQGQRSPLVAA
jgi:hypothetical protein